MTPYTREMAEKILEAMPWIEAVAVDAGGMLSVYDDIPSLCACYWSGNNESTALTRVDCPDWRSSLVVRKWRPKRGELYYVSRPDTSDLYREECWHDDLYDKAAVRQNFVYRTKEEAIAESIRILKWRNQCNTKGAPDDRR